MKWELAILSLVQKSNQKLNCHTEISKFIFQSLLFSIRESSSGRTAVSGTVNRSSNLCSRTIFSFFYLGIAGLLAGQIYKGSGFGLFSQYRWN